MLIQTHFQTPVFLSNGPGLVANGLSVSGAPQTATNTIFGTYFGSLGSMSRYPPSNKPIVLGDLNSGACLVNPVSSREVTSVLTDQPTSDLSGSVRCQPECLGSGQYTSKGGITDAPRDSDDYSSE